MELYWQKGGYMAAFFASAVRYFIFNNRKEEKMDMDFSIFQQVATPSDENRNVSARFYDKAVKTNEVSENGLPIFKNVTYVEIRIKDNSTEIFNQPANPDKIRRFPREYEIYERSKKKIKDGTPLEQFAFLTAAEIATCKNRGIFTVENLADLDFEKVQSLDLQQEHIMAQMFMENASNNGSVSSFVKKEQEYQNKIAALQEKIEILQKRNTQKVVKKNSRKYKGEKS